MSLILYSPRNSMPTSVEEVLAQKYLDKGYTWEPRISLSRKEPPAPTPIVYVDLDVLNHFSEQDLRKIKGVGPALASKIVDARPFISKEDLEERLTKTNWKNIFSQPMPEL